MKGKNVPCKRRSLSKKAVMILLFVSILLSATTALFAAGAAEATADLKPITLTYVSFASADGPHAKAFKYVANKLYEGSNGRVTFQEHYSGSLVGYNEMIDALRDGRADVSLFLPVQDPRSFPLSTVGSVLFVSNDTWAHSQAFIELYEKDSRFEAEWQKQQIVPLWFASIGPAILGAKEPVPNIEWMKNKSIRSTGYFTQALRAVGANPVAMPNPDVYEAMQRGVINAFYASTIEGAALDNRHFEVTSHWQDLRAGEYTVIVTAMSQRAMDKLTAAEKEILFKAVDDLKKIYYTEYFEPLMDYAATLALEGGLKSFTIWPAAETEKFRQLAGPAVLEQWLKDVEASGIPRAEAQSFFDLFVKTVREKEAISPVTMTVTEKAAQRFANQ